MIAYLAMATVPFLGWILSHEVKNIKREHVIDMFFGLFLLILVLRAETVGTDLPNYKFIFTYAKTKGWTVIFNGLCEPLYWFLNYIVTRFTESYRFFLIICAVLSLVPVWKLYRKEADIPLLSIAIFLAVAPVPMYFSGIRQAIAIAFAPIAFELVKKKKLGKFLIVVVVAMGIHVSAFMIVLMYPLYYIKLSRPNLCVVAVSMLPVYLRRHFLYSTAIALVGGQWLRKYGTATVETGAYRALFLMVLFTIYCYLIPENAQLDRDVLGLRNFLVLCVLIQMFAPISSMVMRLGYYYHIFIPLLIPKIAVRSKMNWQIARASIPVMTLFFFAYFFYRAYSGGAGGLGMFPYVTFWSTV